MIADPPITGPWLTRRAAIGVGTTCLIGLAAPAVSAGPLALVEPPSPQPTARPRIDFVCRNCDGNNVTRDAWAEWDVEAQDWVLGAAFDDAFCHDCERETRIKEVAASQV